MSPHEKLLIDFISATNYALSIACDPRVLHELDEVAPALAEWWKAHDALWAAAPVIGVAARGNDEQGRRWGQELRDDLQVIKGAAFWASAPEHTPDPVTAKGAARSFVRMAQQQAETILAGVAKVQNRLFNVRSADGLYTTEKKAPAPATQATQETLAEAILEYRNSIPAKYEQAKAGNQDALKFFTFTAITEKVNKRLMPRGLFVSKHQVKNNEKFKEIKRATKTARGANRMKMNPAPSKPPAAAGVDLRLLERAKKWGEK